MFRYRLTTLFAGLTVAAAMFALTPWVLHRLALQHLATKGATAVLDGQGRHVVSVDFRARSNRDPFGYTDAAGEVGDGEIAWIRHLSEVQRLDLSGTQISDAGLQRLAELEELERLVLDNVALSDDSLRPLSQLRGLKYLSMRDVSRQPLLRSRFLPPAFAEKRAKFSASGLAQLATLTRLLELDLRGLGLEEKDVKPLQESLPKCRILRSFEPLVRIDRRDAPATIRSTLINDLPPAADN